MNKFFLSALALSLLALANAQVDPVEPERLDIVEVVTELVGDVSAFPEWFQQLIAKKLENIVERKDDGDDEPRRRGPPHGGRGRPGSPKRGGRFFEINEEDLEGIEIPDWFMEFRRQMKSRVRGQSGEDEVTFDDDVPEWFQTWFTEFRAGVKEFKQSRKESHQEKHKEIINNLLGDVSALPEWLQQIIAKKLEKDGDKPRNGGPPSRRGGGRKGGRFFKLEDEDLEGIDVPEWFREFREQMESRERGPSAEREITFSENVPEWFQTWFQDLLGKIHELREKRPEHPRTRGGRKPIAGRGRYPGR